MALVCNHHDTRNAFHIPNSRTAHNMMVNSPLVARLMNPSMQVHDFRGHYTTTLIVIPLMPLGRYLQRHDHMRDSCLD